MWRIKPWNPWILIIVCIITFCVMVMTNYKKEGLNVYIVTIKNVCNMLCAIYNLLWPRHFWHAHELHPTIRYVSYSKRLFLASPFNPLLPFPHGPHWQCVTKWIWAFLGNGSPHDQAQSPLSVTFSPLAGERRPWTIGAAQLEMVESRGFGNSLSLCSFLFDSPCSFEATSRCIYSPPPSDNTEAALPVIALQPF